MSPTRRDPDLSLSPRPGPVPSLFLADPELALAGRAGDGRLLLEGERSAAVVRERGGVDDLRVDGRRVATDLTLEAGVVVNLVVSPAALRRERVWGGETLTEVLLAPPRLPLLVLQVGRRPRPAPRGDQGTIADAEAPLRTGAPTPVTGSATLLPDASDLRWHAEGGRLVAVAESGDGGGLGPGDSGVRERVVLTLSPDGGALAAEPGEAGGLRVRFTLPPGDEATLVLALDADGGDPLASLPHLVGHARMAGAAPREGLRLRTGVGSLDTGLDWARIRLATGVRHLGTRLRPSALFWSGLGALAAGDEPAATAWLEALESAGSAPREEEGERSVAGGGPALPAPPLPLLLAGRYALTLGETGPALRLAAGLDRDSLSRPDLAPEEALLWSLALETVAEGLRWTAGERETGELRRLAATLAGRTRGEASPGGVRLPMAGERPVGTGSAGVLRRLLKAEAPAPGTVPAALAAWWALREGRVGEGYARWRRALAEGLSPRGAGRGVWDPPQGAGVPSTGIVMATLAHGLLGWAPDAPVGRAILAPRFPETLIRFSLEGLRVGGASLSLDYEREDDIHRFRLEPTGGRAPVTLVFEPLLPGILADARLDGERVELSPRREPGGTVVPVQLPLDAMRTVELRGPA